MKNQQFYTGDPSPERGPTQQEILKFKQIIGSLIQTQTLAVHSSTNSQILLKTNGMPVNIEWSNEGSYRTGTHVHVSSLVFDISKGRMDMYDGGEYLGALTIKGLNHLDIHESPDANINNFTVSHNDF